MPTALLLHLLARIRSLEAEVQRLRAERDRFRLESVAFSAQLAAFLHAKNHPRINDRLRAFLVRLSRRAAAWRSLLHVVQPRTVVLWHRHGFRYWWRWRS